MNTVIQIWWDGCVWTWVCGPAAAAHLLPDVKHTCQKGCSCLGQQEAIVASSRLKGQLTQKSNCIYSLLPVVLHIHLDCFGVSSRSEWFLSPANRCRSLTWNRSESLRREASNPHRLFLLYLTSARGYGHSVAFMFTSGFQVNRHRATRAWRSNGSVYQWNPSLFK